MQSIAEETFRETEKIDQRMKVLMNEYRRSIPQMRPLPGETRPPAPPEIWELSQKRGALVEEGIEKIKTSLGEKTFAKLHDFIKENSRSDYREVAVPIPRQ